MEKINKNNLKFLGEEYQEKLVKTFIEDPKFFEKMESIVDQNMFTEAPLKNIVRIMKNYFAEKSVAPDYVMINTILGTNNVDEISLQIERERLQKIKTEVSLSGYEKVKEIAERFFKQQNMIKVANKVLKIAGDGDIDRFEECKNEFEKVVELTADDDLGVDPLGNLDETLSSESVEFVPTGIPELDAELGGGLDKGKLGLVIGPTGFGKTTMMTAFAYNAAVQGKKVLQIIFEDDIIDIRRKFASRLSNTEAFMIKTAAERGGLTDAQRAQLRATIDGSPEQKMLRENIRIKRFLPGGGTTATDIINHIKKEINSGFIPDMVTIDYFEPIDHERGTGNLSEWSQEGVTMRKLEGAAKELNIAIWIPSQGGRDSFAAELVTMSMGGGSIKKQQIAQVILSITRSLNDLANATATITLLKNRAGRSGKTFSGIYFDNGQCVISFSGVKVYDDLKAYKNGEKDAEAEATREYSTEYFHSQKENDDPFI